MSSPDKAHTSQAYLADLSIVGHNGPRFKDCGDTLPLVRDDLHDQYAIYSPSRWPNLLWEPWSVIQRRSEAGELTLFGRSHSFLDATSLDRSETPAETQPPSVVVVAAAERFLNWVDSDLSTFVAVNSSLPRRYMVDDSYSYHLCTYPRAMELLDQFARSLLHRWHGVIEHDPENIAIAETLGQLATYVAREKNLRYQSHVRWLCAQYQRDTLSTEFVRRLYQLFVQKQYKVTWDVFRADMDDVYARALSQTRVERAQPNSGAIPIPARVQHLHNLYHRPSRIPSRFGDTNPLFPTGTDQ